MAEKPTTSPGFRLLTTEYAEDILSGKILAGRKVRLACERHFRDLERQGTDAFPWVFDEERGSRPIRFVEKFCKPSQGDFDKLELLAWQHFVVGSLFGWVHRETGIRRYRYGLIFVSRKSGKSTLVSGLSLYMLSKDGEPGARVYQLANSKQQAGVVFEECRAMVDASPLLRKHLRNTIHGIYHDPSKSKIERRATDSKKLDGLNCHFGIFDEIHEYKDYKLINVIKKSVSTRRQPLILYITTAGYQLDGPLMDYYEKAADVLEGIIDDERTFYYMAELDEGDDVDNPDCWIKANPSLGTLLNLETLKEEWENQKRFPQERADFITKQLNTFVQADEEPFLSWEVIKRNADHLDPESLRGQLCIAGYDLSNTEDFTSVCLEFPLSDGRIFVISHSFIPERKVELDNEKLPYREWEQEGLLTICKGDYVTKESVFDWIIEMSKKYSVLMVTQDPAQAFRLGEDLKAYGGEEWLKTVRQGALTLSPALKDLKEMFLAGKVIYNENRLLRWYINNVKLVDDRNGNWLPTKQNRYRKIDGFSALLNAHTEVMKLLAAPPSSGGVTFLSVKDLLADGKEATS